MNAHRRCHDAAILLDRHQRLIGTHHCGFSQHFDEHVVAVGLGLGVAVGMGLGVAVGDDAPVPPPFPPEVAVGAAPPPVPLPPLPPVVGVTPPAAGVVPPVVGDPTPGLVLAGAVDCGLADAADAVQLPG